LWQLYKFGFLLIYFYFCDAGILKKTPSSRVITVSSLAHKFGKCEMDNLNCEKSFPGGTQLYSNAKLYNVLFANELARRLEGTGDDLELFSLQLSKKIMFFRCDQQQFAPRSGKN
jgi:NAD(P)-dependent dehydrogenase (short-subunit alcohol dehydrogenase family)